MNKASALNFIRGSKADEGIKTGAIARVEAANNDEGTINGIVEEVRRAERSKSTGPVMRDKRQGFRSTK